MLDSLRGRGGNGGNLNPPGCGGSEGFDLAPLGLMAPERKRAMFCDADVHQCAACLPEPPHLLNFVLDNILEERPLHAGAQSSQTSDARTSEMPT